MTKTQAAEVPGIPEGVRVVRWGLPLSGEYCLTSIAFMEMGAVAIAKAKGGENQYCLIIEILPGYELIDKRDYGCYLVSRSFPPKEMIVRFTVSNLDEQRQVEMLVKNHPLASKDWVEVAK